MEEYHTKYISVIGARVHNLKNITLHIPRNQLVVITGVSGSGKSSLAFDTLYAEGQRRFIETLSSYARQFMGGMERPDVDKIEGLSPVIAIEQKTISNNPRSTVGTVTEIYDFLRLLYAKVSEARSYVTGEPMIRYTEEEIASIITKEFANQKIQLLAPLVKGRKGIYRALLEKVKQQGFLYVRIDGEIADLTEPIKIDRFKVHDIEVLIDKIKIETNNPVKTDRLRQSVATALKMGKNNLLVINEKGISRYFSKNLMCPTTGIAYEDPSPNTFSFNSPYGACPVCNGIGTMLKVEQKRIIPNPKLSIAEGGIAPLKEIRSEVLMRRIEKLGKKYKFTLKTPLSDFSEEAMRALLYGVDDMLYEETDGYRIPLQWEGIVHFIRRMVSEAESESMQRWAESFMESVPCEECQGTRLKKESLYFYLGGKNIAELSQMSITELYDFITTLKLTEKQQKIAYEILKEIKVRLQFILQVGLGYLSLHRSARTLSGGEAQRVRLATQMGSGLRNVLYILDEPSIGLHPRDNDNLICSLLNVRDQGNSVIVVEHDRDMMMRSDFLIDMGPGAGREGGKVVACGTPQQVMQYNTLTSQYLSLQKVIPVPEKRRKGNGLRIQLHGASGNNLKKINVTFPLQKLICVTGVSGSGKSTLIHETLFPLLHNHFYNTHYEVLPYEKIEGLENIDKVIEIDQRPIGRTPRSNPVTYIGAMSYIRELYALLPESKIRGYKAGRFSFNVKGGRCETCGGAGVQTIQMNFLPDVYITCPVCKGKRYNRETLQVRFKGKNINDVLEMTVDEALVFFENHPLITNKLKILQEVGLGYLQLGQPSTTLSGGEAQRVKLAAELSKKATGNTFYILDEPTTGLHFHDIKMLLEVLNRLVDKGNTVLVIEHNLDVIKCADHIIDLGPEGGSQGGYVMFEGTPEEMVRIENNHTARYLRKEIMQNTF